MEIFHERNHPAMGVTPWHPEVRPRQPRRCPNWSQQQQRSCPKFASRINGCREIPNRKIGKPWFLPSSIGFFLSFSVNIFPSSNFMNSMFLSSRRIDVEFFLCTGFITFCEGYFAHCSRNYRRGQGLALDQVKP